MNIYQKLIEVRKSVPYLKKDNEGFKFSFVSSSQTLGTLRAAMDEMGLLLIPSVLADEVRDHKTAKGGHEYFTKISIKFVWVNAENPEEQVESMWIGQGLDSGEKGVGKAVTYAEKYFLLKFFNIATDKDDPDSFQDKFKGPEPITEFDSKKIKSLIADTDSDIEKLLRFFKVKSVDDLDSKQAGQAILMLSKKEKVAA